MFYRHINDIKSLGKVVLHTHKKTIMVNMD
jgi:hypothetical protein